MRTVKLSILSLLGMLLLVASPAYAYVGPGLGAGVIAVVLGILGSIVMFFAALVWFPIKRLLKRRSAAKKKAIEPQ